MQSSPPGKIGLFGIRRKILVFAACATLLPSLLLGWVAYFKTHQLLLEKTEHQLLRLVNHAVQSLEGLLERRLDDLGVFAGSNLVRENLERHLQPELAANDRSGAEHSSPASVLSDYLGLLSSETGDYRQLQVLGQTGQPIAWTPGAEAGPDIPVAWLTGLTQPALIPLGGQPRANAGAYRIIAVAPISASHGSRIGFLAGEIPLPSVAAVLRFPSIMEGVEVLLVGESGRVLLQQGARGRRPTQPASPDQELADLFLYPGQIDIYQDRDRRKVAGLAMPVGELPWGLVVEIAYDSAFAEVNQLRDVSLAIVLLLLLGFGLLSYLVSQGILVPLGRLSGAAAMVAEGDLNVQIDSRSRDELGFAIQVFNDMVGRLRASREQLEKMTVVDSLTGLFTRKHIIELLELQLQRYRRNGPRFSILMADLDHFKSINDRYGHLAGDEALRGVGKVFRGLLRSVDSAARYGGEEFLIILEQASQPEALRTAERIRAAMESTELSFEGQRIPITISIGVATVGEEREVSAEEVIRVADRQLYRAKESGRNRVMPVVGVRLFSAGGGVVNENG